MTNRNHYGFDDDDAISMQSEEGVKQKAIAANEAFVTAMQDAIDNGFERVKFGINTEPGNFRSTDRRIYANPLFSMTGSSAARAVDTGGTDHAKSPSSLFFAV